MSTYTHRYIEVEREMIDGYRWKYEKLPDPETVVGKIYKISEYNLPDGIHRYYKSIKFTGSEAKWVPVDKVEKKWIPVRWYFEANDLDQGENTYEAQYEAQRNHFRCKDKFGRELHLEEGFMWCNNGGYVRDDYIGRGWGETVFQDRGLPDDVSDIIKKDIESDHHYGMTYVMLDEWEKLFNVELEKFAVEVKKRFRDEKVEEALEKLDIVLAGNKRITEILHKMKEGLDLGTEKPLKKKKKKEEEDDGLVMWEDTIAYMFEEEIWRLFHIQTEIDRCEFIVQEFGGEYTGKVRIIYYLA